MVPDVGHFEQTGVKARILEGLLEQGLVGTGGAGGHHYTVQTLNPDFLSDQFLGALGAAIEIGVHEDYIIQSSRIIRHRRHIHHPANIGAAGAYENPQARLCCGLHFRRIRFHLDLSPPGSL